MKHPEHVIVVPSGTLALPSQVVFRRLLQLEQIQGKMPHYGEVCGFKAHPRLAQSLLKGDFQRPVQVILDAPVSPHGLGEALHIAVQAGHKERQTALNLVAAAANAFDDPNRAKLPPFPLVVEYAT